MALLLESHDFHPHEPVAAGPAPARLIRPVACDATIASFRDIDGMPDDAVLREVPPGAQTIALAFEGCDIFACRDLAAVAGLWIAFQKTAVLTPFQRFEWLSSWHRISPGRNRPEPFVVLVFEAGRLRLVAPLALERDALACRLVWLGHRINDHNAPLVERSWFAGLDPRRAANLWRRVTQACDEADYVHLIRQPSHLGAWRNPFLGDEPQFYSSDSHYLKLSHDWPAFYASLRGSKSRRRLREKARRLGKDGPVKLRRIRTGQDTAAMIETILAWKQEQLERRGARNPFRDGRMAELLFSLAKIPGNGAMMRVYALEVAGRPVAGTVVLVHGGTFNFFISAYEDTGIRNHSPGTIMLVRLLELAARAGCTTFDFSLGDEHYKTEWCDGRMQMSHQTEALNLRGAAWAMLARARVRTKKTIKSRHRLLGALQSANATATALRRALGTPVRCLSK